MRSFLIAAVVCLLPLAGAEARMASSTELSEAIVGNTLQGALQGEAQFSEYYTVDGDVRGDGYVGTWSVEGDHLCHQIMPNPKSCWQLEITGSDVKIFKDGKHRGGATILSGNPLGL